MLSNTTIENYIETIPAIPKIVKECIIILNQGELVSAADKANEDKALIHYLQNIVNKPIFGFRDEVKNARQIFGILGLAKVKQLIYSYYLILILPKKWEVFDFSSTDFQIFQARLIYNWGKIVKFLKKEDDELIQSISIIPASLIVCEVLFLDINDTVKLLREKKQMSYEAILYKMTEKKLSDISGMIGKKWDFSDKVVDMIKEIGDTSKSDFGENTLAISYLRLLLLYEMSQSSMIKSGLNDLFDFEITLDDDITNNFYEIIKSDG